MTRYNQNNEVLSFHIYMWNKWSMDECKKIFENVSDHIWNKWCRYCDEVGATAAPSLMIRDLDSINLDKLINRACELYDGRKNR